MTNSPIESYNNTIKKFFTDRKRLNMLPAIEIFESQIKHESNVHREIQECAKVTQQLIKEAKQELNSSECNLVLKEQQNETYNYVYNYEFENKTYMFEISLNRECTCILCCRCTCMLFLDKAMCIHFVMALINAKMPFLGLLIAKAKFVGKLKKGRPSLAKKALYIQ